MKRKSSVLRNVVMISLSLVIVFLISSCSKKENESIVIYTSAEDYRVDYLQSRLREEFPQYSIVFEYMSTGNHAARLLAEGTSTEADITYDLEYGYLSRLDKEGVLADLSEYDMDKFDDEIIISKNFIPELRNGGAIIINKVIFESEKLPYPQSYHDLLKPEYKNLISMANPKSSGTGYMFLKSLVNAWSEDEAFLYFDKLTDNILQYTSSGSGPVNALLQGEAAIGLGMTAQAVTKINEGENFEILFFPEGSPYSMYGQAIIKGKETKPAVIEVFDFLYNSFVYENNELFYPEKIFKDIEFLLPNYPKDIKYADMSNDTLAEKERLLDQWKH